MGYFIFVFLFITTQPLFVFANPTQICTKALNCCQDLSLCKYPFSPSSYTFKDFLEKNSDIIFSNAGIALNPADSDTQKACLLSTVTLQKSVSIFKSYSHFEFCKLANRQTLQFLLSPSCSKARGMAHKLRRKVLHLSSNALATAPCSQTGTNYSSL